MLAADPKPRRPQMPDMNQLAQRYIDTFNETDPERRRKLLEDLYAPDATYTDPHVELRGTAELEAFIASTQERFPGYVFSLAGDVDAHHGQSRFQWYAGPADSATPEYVGFDVVVTDGQRVRSVYGFLDAAPAA
jgi:SnoaL-like domain